MWELWFKIHNSFFTPNKRTYFCTFILLFNFFFFPSFISFCGLRMKDMENTSRAVLPKFYLENLNLEAYEVVASVGSRVFFTTMPKVMVEGFLKEYLNADAVIATELHTAGCYFTGFLSKSGLLVKHSARQGFSLT